jgi:hypothetical protein
MIDFVLGSLAEGHPVEVVAALSGWTAARVITAGAEHGMRLEASSHRMVPADLDDTEKGFLAEMAARTVAA